MPKRAFGYSDRSGKRYNIKDLVEEYVNQVPTGFLVGRDEVDIDHEQLRLGEVEANDPEMLENPRPDQSLDISRALYSWSPVGAVGLGMKGEVGRVKVSTS